MGTNSLPSSATAIGSEEMGILDKRRFPLREGNENCGTIGYGKHVAIWRQQAATIFRQKRGVTVGDKDRLNANARPGIDRRQIRGLIGWRWAAGIHVARPTPLPARDRCRQRAVVQVVLCECNPTERSAAGLQRHPMPW
jgi:hypothetical protein